MQVAFFCAVTEYADEILEVYINDDVRVQLSSVISQPPHNEG